MPLTSPLMPVPHLSSCSAYKNIRDKHYHHIQLSYIFTNIPKHIVNYLLELNTFNTLYSPASAATADICCTLFSTTYLLTYLLYGTIWSTCADSAGKPQPTLEDPWEPGLISFKSRPVEQKTKGRKEKSCMLFKSCLSAVDVSIITVRRYA